MPASCHLASPWGFRSQKKVLHSYITHVFVSKVENGHGIVSIVELFIALFLMVFLVILSHLVGHAWLYFMSLYHINIREETLQHATFSLQFSSLPFLYYV